VIPVFVAVITFRHPKRRAASVAAMISNNAKAITIVTRSLPTPLA
jgi:hypothetical protein